MTTPKTKSNVFRDRLDDAMKRAGLSGMALAARLGLSTDTNVRNWQEGAWPQSDQLPMLAVALEVSADYLVGTSEDPTPPDALRTGALSTALQHSGWWRGRITIDDVRWLADQAVPLALHDRKTELTPEQCIELVIDALKRCPRPED